MIQQNLDSQSYFEKSQSQGCESQNADREFTTPNQNDQSYFEDEDEDDNAENSGESRYGGEYGIEGEEASYNSDYD